MKQRLINITAKILPYVPVTLAFIVIVWLYWWLLSQTTGSLIGFGWRGDAYDSLATSLLQGSAEVAPSKIQVEAFSVNGQTFMYFGPFPAIFRVPFVMAQSPWVDKLSPLSCFVACLISIVAFTSICATHARRFPFLGAALLIGFGAGTPLMFLAISTSIYHEAIMWGLAGAMGATASLLMILRKAASPHLWLSVCALSATIAFLSRMTFGGPAFLALGIGVLAIVFTSRFSWVKTPSALLPALIGVVFQGWYNFVRFGSPFSPAKFGSSVYYLDPNSMGGWFNTARIPELFGIYFKPGLQFFFADFPFVRMQRVVFSDPSMFFHWKEPVAPLTITCSWIVVLAVIGLISIIRRKEWYLAAAAVAFLATWIPILSFFNVTERFTAEFIPTLVFLTACGIERCRPLAESWMLKIITVVLVCASVLSTVSSAIAWPPMVTGVPLVSEGIDKAFRATYSN
jgi:hypothetical protein